MNTCLIHHPGETEIVKNFIVVILLMARCSGGGASTVPRQQWWYLESNQSWPITQTTPQCWILSSSPCSSSSPQALLHLRLEKLSLLEHHFTLLRSLLIRDSLIKSLEEYIIWFIFCNFYRIAKRSGSCVVKHTEAIRRLKVVKNIGANDFPSSLSLARECLLWEVFKKFDFSNDYYYSRFDFITSTYHTKPTPKI